LYVADLSNIEARMLAWLAKEADLIDAFAAGRDVYSEFASEIYGRTITKANKLERYVGKTAILGLGYGMGADKFRYTLKSGSPSVDITDQTALAIVSQYRAKYPNINRLWYACKQLLFSMMNRASENTNYGPLTVKYNALELPNG
jgi:DNA polymerase